MSLDENKFFIISQSLVMQFIFGSISNQQKFTNSIFSYNLHEKKSKEKTRGKKLEKFIEFDLSTLEFERSEKREEKVVAERCQNNYTRCACNQ